MAKTILVTGGTGFVGKHLMARLNAAYEGATIIPLGLNHGEWPSDLLDAKRVQEVFARYKPDVVYHLASRVGGIGANQDAPWEYLVDTLRMGLNVIEACGDHDVQDLILVGSVCCYPYEPPVPFREEDLWSGYPEPTNAPYGIAKRALQEALRVGHLKYKFRYAFPIPTNIYGPGDNFDLRTSHVIPAVIAKVHSCLTAEGTQGTTIPLWGSGAVSRDFLYVEDVAEGILKCGQYLETVGENLPGLNLGTGVETPVWKVAELIRDRMDCEAALVWNTSMPDGQPRRVLDMSKTKEILNWAHSVDLDEGLGNTIDWYRENLISS